MYKINLGYKGENCDKTGLIFNMGKHTWRIIIISVVSFLVATILVVTLIQMKRKGKYVLANIIVLSKLVY